MYPAPIDHYHRPTTRAEALSILGQYDPGDAVFFAGGQSIMQAMKSRILQPQAIIDLQAVDDMRGISASGDHIVVGAMTRYVEISASAELALQFSALCDAAAHVGDRQVRNRGTIGGSLCWNYVASCSPAAALGLGCEISLTRSDGTERSVAIDDFLLGPLETARGDDELMTQVSFRRSTGRAGSAYKKWGLVRDALPVVGVCVAVELDNKGNCQTARLSLSGMAAGATRVPDGESALVGSGGAPDELDAIFAEIAEGVDTHSDASADANYRRQLIRSIGAEVAGLAFTRALA